jgi:hypothetical protein
LDSRSIQGVQGVARTLKKIHVKVGGKKVRKAVPETRDLLKLTAVQTRSSYGTQAYF